MKTGFGLYKKYRVLLSYFNLFRFSLRKIIIGFDVANQFLSRTDKNSIGLILRRFGATIGNDCEFDNGIVMHNCSDYSNLFIGNNCHLGKNCFLDLRDKIIIDDNVVISMNVTLLTHFDIYYSSLREYYPEKNDQVIIGKNSYIGAGATIMMGINIGNNCIIGAGALVTKNVPSNFIVGGVPAKLIRELNSL